MSSPAHARNDPTLAPVPHVSSDAWLLSNLAVPIESMLWCTIVYRYSRYTYNVAPSLLLKLRRRKSGPACRIPLGADFSDPNRKASGHGMHVLTRGWLRHQQRVENCFLGRVDRNADHARS